MGFGGLVRAEFVEAFNRVFSAARIVETSQRLGPQLPSMDALEIVHRLGLLTWVPTERFFEYRDSVGIPALHLQVMTTVLQAALHARADTALTLAILEGDEEHVSVSQRSGHISVVLTRTGFEPPAAAQAGTH